MSAGRRIIRRVARYLLAAAALVPVTILSQVFWEFVVGTGVLDYVLKAPRPDGLAAFTDGMVAMHLLWWAES